MVAGEVVNEGGRFTRIDRDARSPSAARPATATCAPRWRLHAPWLRQEMPAHLGALVHRVELEKVSTRPEPNLHTTTDKAAA
jgi:hypothetical protein